MKFKEFYLELESEIERSYTSGVTMDEAEKLAGKFLHGMMRISEELKSASLDAKMKKSGLKAIKAAVYLQEATKGDKKPSDVLLNALVDSNDVVQGEQTGLDQAEASKEELERLFDAFRESHVHFRQVSKGAMG